MTDLLMVADETAVPAVCTVLEQLTPTATGAVFMEVPSSADVLDVRGPAGVSVTSGGAITLHSGAAADASATADGSASSGGPATVGAGVAITLANFTNSSAIAGSAASNGAALTADQASSSDLSATPGAVRRTID